MHEDCGPQTEAIAFGVKSFHVSLFRSIEDASCSLGTFNVFVGVNGSGKTSVLRAIAFVLEDLVRRIGPRALQGQRPKPYDLRKGRITRIEVDLINQDAISTLYRYFAVSDQAVLDIRRLPHRDGQMQDLTRRVAEIASFYWSALSEELPTTLPLVCFYPVERAIDEVPLRIRSKDAFSRRSGYDRAFTSQRNFRSFFQWFREQEDAENEQARNGAYRDPVLSSVRHAIDVAMPGYSNLRVERKPRLRMLIDKGDIPVSIQQLSDGERGVLALVGDMAKRSALLNPHLSNPCDAPGCVLIDEIDLHLHPQWQRHLVTILPQVFPNIQFICATHSPIVCGSVRTENLLILEDGEVKPAKVYGWSAADILKRVFDISDRPPEIEERLQSLDQALDSGNVAESEEILKVLEEDLPQDDPEIVRANVVLPFIKNAAEDNAVN